MSTRTKNSSRTRSPRSGTHDTVVALLRGERVLVVDDNAGAREMLADTCIELGLQADAVTGGAEAVSAVKAKAATLDMRMLRLPPTSVQ